MDLITTVAPNPAPTTSTGLPMWGELENKVLISHGQQLGNLTLFRALARIDVGTFNGVIPALGIDAWTALDNFKIEEVKIYNAQDNYRVTPLMANFSFGSGGMITGTSLSGSASATTVTCTDIVTSGGIGLGVMRGLYMAEADVIMGGTYGDGNHLNRPCLLVKGYYKPLGASIFNTSPSWYRIDFLKTNKTLHDILRNYNYQAVITEVAGPGQPSEEEALKTFNVDLTAKIHKWTSSEQVNTVIDGTNWLKVDRKDIEFDKWARTSEEITITTNVSSGWSAEITSAGSSWIPLTNGTAGVVTGNSDDVVIFNISQNDLIDRNAVITVTAGKMKLDIKISQTTDVGEHFLRLSSSEVIIPARKWNPGTSSWTDPDPQSITVQWAPPINPYYMELTPYLEGGIIGTGLPGNPGNTTSSSPTVNIDLDMLADTDPRVVANPFFERSSRLGFTVFDQANNPATKIVKQVLVKQVFYSMLITDTEDYYMQGENYEFTIRSNSPWVATITNTNGIMENINTTSGVGSTTAAGEKFSFKIGNTATVDAVATVVFSSPDNLFLPQTFLICAQDEQPNSYSVRSNTTFSIPVHKAYRVWKWDRDLKGLNANGDLPATGVKAAELLWEDVSGLITGVTCTQPANPMNAVINVTTAAGKTGNAVVVYKIGGTIYWSWHVWVTSAAVGSQTVGTYVFMDRNLGAMGTTEGNVNTFGLLYQANRKDPYPPATGFGSSTFKTIYKGAATVTIQAVIPEPNDRIAPTIHAPLTRILGTYGPNTNWYAPLYDARVNLWSAVRKTDYDPCPRGWRVISQAAVELHFMTVPTSVNNGYKWGSIYFPAQGIMHTSEHLLSANSFYLHTAPPKGSTALAFTANGLTNPAFNGRPTRGAATRCMMDN